MAREIHIQPVEGWGYFAKNRSRLSEELVEIASDTDSKTSVYMTEEDGNPYLYVYRNDRKIFQSACSTIYEVERNLRVIYAQYLTNFTTVGEDDAAQEDEDNTRTVDHDDDDVPPCSDLDEMTEAEFNDYVSEREDVIIAAVFDLLEVLTEDETGSLQSNSKDGVTFEDVVDHIVEYLAIKGGFRIRRPMTVLDEESGLHVRTEYPYEEFDFSDGELH